MVIWERFTTKKIVVNGKEKFESRCEVWRHKWNTKWNILCVKIVALLSFTILITFIIHKNLTDTMDSKKEIRRKALMRFKLYHDQIYQLKENRQCEYKTCSEYGFQNLCCFTCKDFYIDAGSIDEIIGKHPDYDQKRCSNKLVLTLENCKYPENKLVNLWSSIPISQLIIKGNIEDIEDGAFNSKALGKIIRITLKFPKIKYYRKNMFQGLSVLRWLEIQNSDPLSFEENVLEHIASTIGTLQVTESNLEDPISIHNLTSVYMPNLLDIDLQFNLLKALPSNAFHNAPSLVAVYLTKNLLSILHKTNFLPNIKSIGIDGNNWLCNCEMYWLRNINIIGGNNARCLDGNQSKDFNTIFEMDCENLPSTTENPTSTPASTPSANTEISTSSSEESSSVTIPHESTPPTNTEGEGDTSTTFSEDTPSTTNAEGDTSSTLSEETSSTTAAEKETDDGMWFPDEEKFTCMRNMVNDLNVFPRNGKLIVQYPNANKNAQYFFFHSKNIKYCNMMSSQGVVEGNFEPNTSYTFCEKSLTDEMQCLSGRTLPLYEDQTWMTNQDKIPVILIGTFVNLFSIVFSGVVTYFCLRKHPSLLRKSNDQSNFVMPSKPVYLFPRPDVFPSRNEQLTLGRHYPPPFVPVRERPVTYIPVRDASYFSPVSERYMYVRQKPTLHRSVSDVSLRTVASYVTENQIPSWRKRSKKERAPVAKLFDEPPPLPPPRNKCEVIVGENEILSQSSHQYW